jgi:hypothetical protein
MAKLQRFRTHEALNTESAAIWDVQSAVTADSDGVAVNVSGYHQIHIQTNNDIYFRFNVSGTASAIDTSNDLYVKGGDTIYSFKVPSGLGDTIYLIMERKGSSDATVRMILA